MIQISRAKVVYTIVTNDEYELPIKDIVGAKETAMFLKMSTNTFYNCISLGNWSKKLTYKAYMNEDATNEYQTTKRNADTQRKKSIEYMDKQNEKYNRNYRNRKDVNDLICRKLDSIDKQIKEHNKAIAKLETEYRKYADAICLLDSVYERS